MKHIELLNSFREHVSQLVAEVEAAVAMGHFDINKISEDVYCGVISNLYGLDNLRNLNAEEKKNFPGIDLADETHRVGIQVTSDASLDKVKSTLASIREHKLYKKFDRFIIYVITRRQASYSQPAADKICDDLFPFDTKHDIIDFRELSTRAATAEPRKLQAAVEHIMSYRRGVGVGLADEDFDPPAAPPERVGTNLVEVFFPGDLYVAEVVTEAITTDKGKKVKNQRKGLREFADSELGKKLPSAYEVLGGRIITFHNIDARKHPFIGLIEQDTVECFSPKDFYLIDDDHERVFKSLLRLLLQQKLFPHRVMWQHLEHKFIFLPLRDDDNKRSESWTGKKTSSRMVYERKYNRNNPEKILSTRHLAFGVEFVRTGDAWFIAITPDWLFSFGNDYRRSHFGEKLLSGLKRMENNRAVYDQVRFLAAWLESVDREDLFATDGPSAPTLTFSELIVAEGGRHLNEALWAPLETPDEDALQDRLGVR